MKDTALPEDADQLLAFGQSLVTVLSESPDKWGVDKDVEALLRASVSAATYAVNTYMAVLVSARKSPLAAGCIKEAKTRCDRNIAYLRRRITKSIAHLCRYLSNHDLSQAAQYVILLSR